MEEEDRHSGWCKCEEMAGKQGQLCKGHRTEQTGREPKNHLQIGVAIENDAWSVEPQTAETPRVQNVPMDRKMHGKL